jgi:hypothetical protein
VTALDCGRAFQTRLFSKAPRFSYHEARLYMQPCTFPRHCFPPSICLSSLRSINPLTLLRYRLAIRTILLLTLRNSQVCVCQRQADACLAGLPSALRILNAFSITASALSTDRSTKLSNSSIDLFLYAPHPTMPTSHATCWSETPASCSLAGRAWSGTRARRRRSCSCWRMICRGRSSDSRGFPCRACRRGCKFVGRCRLGHWLLCLH